MKVKKFQMGGPMGPEEGMPVEGGAPVEAGMEEQIIMMAQEIIQQIGPEAAAMLAEAIMQMLQAAMAPQGGEPLYQRKGGKIKARIR